MTPRIGHSIVDAAVAEAPTPCEVICFSRRDAAVRGLWSGVCLATLMAALAGLVGKGDATGWLLVACVFNGLIGWLGGLVIHRVSR